MVRLAFISLAAVFAPLARSSPLTPHQPFLSLPITKKQAKIAAKDLVFKGKSRLASFSAAGSVPLTNEDVTYVVSTIIDTKTYLLAVDTGSGLILINTSAKTVGTVAAASPVGLTCHTAKVTIGAYTVPKQTVCSPASSGFGVDGTFGFGPADLNVGTVGGTATVATFMDNLKTQGSISTEILGVYFAPEAGSDTGDGNGSLSIGAVDTTKYTGTLTYTPKITAGAYSSYWSVAVSAVSYGSTVLSSSTNALVDTGTTLIYVPTVVYNKFLSATGGKTDSVSGLAVFTTQPTGTITFTIGGAALTLKPAQYLVPTAQYSYFGLTSGKYYAWINDGGSTGVNFIIGQKFLENYYSVYDTPNSRVGFATRA